MSKFPEAINREEWLTRAVPLLSQIIEETELLSVPSDVRVSCGWPGGRSFIKVIGQCWNQAASNGAPQVFISPILKDPIEVLETLLHELIHAADDNEHHHKGVFVKCARACGLEGKPTATFAGDELKERLSAILGTLGEYPHSGMKPGVTTKPQTTRMLKLVCPECDYTVRTTKKWIEIAVPLCNNVLEHETEEPVDMELAE